jgi:hypothetical protein
MKIVVLTTFILLSGCAGEMKNALKNTEITVGQSVIDKIPLIKKKHDYTVNTSVYGYDEQWCEIHQKWEKVSITYKPTMLSKLRKIEYTLDEENN